jgi:septal ring factor EnvC (AmiA/AmiB activator)
VVARVVRELFNLSLDLNILFFVLSHDHYLFVFSHSVQSRVELEQARSLLTAARGELVDRQQQLAASLERVRTCEAELTSTAERLRSQTHECEEMRAQLTAEKQRSEHAKVLKYLTVMVQSPCFVLSAEVTAG